jgi:hypothetical protein
VPDRTTRLIIPIAVVTGVAAVGVGVGWSEQPATLPLPETTPDPPAAVSSVPSLGLVRIDYRLERQRGHASNQVAVWIEDAAGRHVRSLFATSFTAEGGYVRRPMSLPAWRESAQWEEAGDELVEEVARPAQDSGTHSLYWDGLDESGAPVAPGSYRFLVEGNLRWENRVLFTGTVAIGSDPASGAASAEYAPVGAEAHAGMLADVRAEFLPGERMQPDMISAYTRGS